MVFSMLCPYPRGYFTIFRYPWSHMIDGFKNEKVHLWHKWLGHWTHRWHDNWANQTKIGALTEKWKPKSDKTTKAILQYLIEFKIPIINSFSYKIISYSHIIMLLTNQNILKVPLQTLIIENGNIVTEISWFENKRKYSVDQLKFMPSSVFLPLPPIYQPLKLAFY